MRIFIFYFSYFITNITTFCIHMNSKLAASQLKWLNIQQKKTKFQNKQKTIEQKSLGNAIQN
jgi:hypothetical protein